MDPRQSPDFPTCIHCGVPLSRHKGGPCDPDEPLSCGEVALGFALVGILSALACLVASFMNGH